MKKVIIVCVFLSFLWSGILSANELRGDEVLDKVERAMDASSVHMEITMKLYNSAGDSRERSLEVYRKRADRYSILWMILPG